MHSNSNVPGLGPTQVDDVVTQLGAQTAPLVAIVSGTAAAGLGVAVVKWGFPIGVQMFKSLAKK